MEDLNNKDIEKLIKLVDLALDGYIEKPKVSMELRGKLISFIDGFILRLDLWEKHKKKLKTIKSLKSDKSTKYHYFTDIIVEGEEIRLYWTGLEGKQAWSTNFSKRGISTSNMFDTSKSNIQQVLETTNA